MFVPWRPSFQIWMDYIWVILTLFVLIFLTYSKDLDPMTSKSHYFFSLVKCLLPVNKIIFTVFIISFIYDKSECPSNTKNVFLWRYNIYTLIT